MSDELWNTPFKYGYGWEVLTECCQVIQLAKFTPIEIQERKVHCPMPADIYAHHSYGQLEKIVKYKRIKFASFHKGEIKGGKIE